MADPLVFIMAGGSGERFWPLSRRSKPKHLLRLFSDRTLLEETLLRVEGVVPLSNIYVLTNEEQLDGVREAVPFLEPSQVLVEPAKRDTASAAALATAIARTRDPHAVVALLPADALVRNLRTFRQQFTQGLKLAAESPCFVTFAIHPTYPATGFGYLERGEALPGGAYRVKRFVEKPSESRAAAYLEAGTFGWNSGIFAWQASAFLNEAQRLQPQLANFILEFPQEDYAGYLEERFHKLPKISLDYAMMEQANDVICIQARFDWDDVGTWTSLPQHLGVDAQGNTLIGEVEQIEASNTIVFSEGRFVGLCGVRDLVVVETPDAVLVCHRDQVHQIKQLLPKVPGELC